MDHHPCPQTGCGGLRAPCVIRSPGGHRASGDDGLQVLWWFWGFSVGGEKGSPACPSKFLPCKPLGLCLWLLAFGQSWGCPLPRWLGCPRGPFMHGHKCLLCCEAIFLPFPLFVCPCAYMLPRELCVGCHYQHVNIYSGLFESLPTSLTASSPGSFFVSPGPDMRLAECLLKQPGFEIQSQIAWTASK